jgi:hypothetical protein
MFKNNYYKKNKDIIIVPKRPEKQDLKTVVKPNVNKSNYENIRNIVENNDQESISNSNVKEIKNIKNKLNIV